MKHILIDYENIQPKKLNGIRQDECQIWLFLGVNQQKSIPLELVETLLRFNNRHVHIIRMQHTGKNALDFYLSFYLGKISEIDPQADICILAKDSGYDILVEHLNTVYEGLNIVRSPSTNHLNFIYESEDSSASAVDKSQLITIANQDNLYEQFSKVGIKHKTSSVQSFEQQIPKVVIHDSYLLVFNNLIKDDNFLPSCKSNLLSAIKKYVLATTLEGFSSTEQDYIVEQVFEKLNKAGLISIDEKSQKLSYRVDRQGILDLVTDKVLLSKAKTVDGLSNVIKQKLASYCQAYDNEQVDLVISWLKNEGLIKQENQAIYYLNLDAKEVNKNKIAKADSSHSKLDSTVYQRAIAAVKNRPLGSRPSKKSNLVNYLKSHLRNEDSKVIDNLIKQMINNKVIVISDNSKLTYKI